MGCADCEGMNEREGDRSIAMNLFRRLFGKKEARGSSKVEQDGFAELMMDALRRAGIEEFEYNDEDYSIRIAGEEGRTMYLGNLYEDFLHLEGGQAELDQFFLRNIQASFSELPETFEQARARLFPVVRERVFSEFIVLRARLGDGDKLRDGLPGRVISDYLTALLGYDSEFSIGYVSQSTLDDWGVSWTEAFDAACANLLANSGDGFREVKPGVYASPWSDNYDSSRLLVPELLTDLNVKGRPVVVIPNRDTLLVTGDGDIDGLVAMLELTANALDEARPMRARPLVWVDGSWQNYFPTVDSPVVRMIEELNLRSAGSDYAEQKELLDAIHEKEMKDVFVASYTIVQKDETGELFSYCVWSEALTDQWLPETDQVFLLTEDGKTYLIPWEDLMNHFGSSYLADEGVFPRRYRATAFPEHVRIESVAGGEFG